MKLFLTAINKGLVKKFQATILIARTILMVSPIVIAFRATAQLPVYPDSLFSTYYHQRWTLFKALPRFKGKDWQNPVKLMFTFVELDEVFNDSLHVYPLLN